MKTTFDLKKYQILIDHETITAKGGQRNLEVSEQELANVLPTFNYHLKWKINQLARIKNYTQYSKIPTVIRPHQVTRQNGLTVGIGTRN